MTIKKLSQCAQIELGLDSIFARKVWVFVAIVGQRGGPNAALGIAVANESGYNPIPAFWAHAESFEEMDAHADELNAARGFDPKTAMRIVCSTMNGRAFPADPESLPVAVTFARPGQKAATILTRMATIRDAEQFIADLPDSEEKAAGYYGVDAPEHMAA